MEGHLQGHIDDLGHPSPNQVTFLVPVAQTKETCYRRNFSKNAYIPKNWTVAHILPLRAYEWNEETNYGDPNVSRKEREYIIREYS